MTFNSSNPMPLGECNDRWAVSGPLLPADPPSTADHDQIRAALTDMVLSGLEGIKAITFELEDGPLVYRRLP